MDNRNRFDGKGEIYAKARPKYAEALFEYLKNVLNVPFDSVFADIGSGTGIFTEQLLDCWRKVYAVEPNADMRRKAEKRLSRIEGFISVDGSDADTKLPDGSVDFVTAAQAFLWFDAEAFGKECRRILRPGGKVMIIYNFRDPNAACTKALAELRHRYSPEFQGFSNGINDEKCKAFFVRECTVFRADNTQYYDRQGYIDRVLSSSYSTRESDGRYSEYLTDIGRVFDSFSADGIIAVPTKTAAYIGKV